MFIILTHLDNKTHICINFIYEMILKIDNKNNDLTDSDSSSIKLTIKKTSYIFKIK